MPNQSSTGRRNATLSRLRELSAKGDDLERIAVLVDPAMFRATLKRAVPRLDGTKVGRPALDRVLMSKIMLLQAMHARVARGTLMLFGMSRSVSPI